MEPHRLLAAILPYCIPVVVFALSTRSTLGEVVETLKNRAALLRLCVVCFVANPLVAVLLCKVLSPLELVKGVIIVSAISPGDPFLVLEAEHKKGNLPLSQALALVFTVALPFMLLAWLPVIDWWFTSSLHAKSLGAFLKVAAIVLPFVLGGVLLRTYAPRLTERLQRPLKLVAVAAYVLIGIVVVVASVKSIATYTLATAAAIFLYTSVSLLLGYFASGYATERSRRTAGLAAALGNIIVVLFVALDTYHFPAQQVGGVIAVAVVIRVLTIYAWNAFAKRSAATAAAEPAA